MTALLILNIIVIGFAVAAWLSPVLLDNIGTNAKARAAALRQSRKVYLATYNASMGRRVSFASTSLGKAKPLTLLGRVMTTVSALFGLILIAAAIAALVVMPQ